jgi:FAD binding domain-containing protein
MTSRALAVQARTLELYDQLGLGKTVVERSRAALPPICGSLASGGRIWHLGICFPPITFITASQTVSVTGELSCELSCSAMHSPVRGQGMNTGIGDAVNLAWKLAWV